MFSNLKLILLKTIYYTKNALNVYLCILLQLFGFIYFKSLFSDSHPVRNLESLLEEVYLIIGDIIYI